MKEKKFIKFNNFINIQGWMVTELGLKGNQLVIFACIYGFSQDGENWFEGTRAYLAEWCSISQKHIGMNLKQLCDAGLLIKDERVINQVKLCRYKVNFETLNKIFYFNEEDAASEERNTEGSEHEEIKFEDGLDLEEAKESKAEQDELPKNFEIDEVNKMNPLKVPPRDKRSLPETKSPYPRQKIPTRGQKDSGGRDLLSLYNKIDNKNNNINNPSFYLPLYQGESMSKNKREGRKDKTGLGIDISMQEKYKITERITKKMIGYDDLHLIYPGDSKLIDAMLYLIIEIRCSEAKTIRIGQEEKPAEIVKAQFAKLQFENIEQVLENLRNNASQIKNVKQYMLTVLYNSIFTADYQIRAKMNYLHNKAIAKE